MPAVFQFEGAMCEPATHHHWAVQVIERAKHFGCHLHAVAVDEEAVDILPTAKAGGFLLRDGNALPRECS
jgi:hypothetical protein